MSKTLEALHRCSRSSWYWLFILTLGIALESTALFYQYVLDYWPCVLCIHVRIWVLAMIVVAVAGLLLRNRRPLRFVTHLLLAGIAAGLLERAWLLLGTERGTIIGSCDMESGLPTWFALDIWFPAMFKVWEACGYTPELVFGITMAEALLPMSAALLLAGILLSIASLKKP